MGSTVVTTVVVAVAPSLSVTVEGGDVGPGHLVHVGRVRQNWRCHRHRSPGVGDDRAVLLLVLQSRPS